MSSLATSSLKHVKDIERRKFIYEATEVYRRALTYLKKHHNYETDNKTFARLAIKIKSTETAEQDCIIRKK